MPIRYKLDFGLVVPSDPITCHPLPDNWVAKSVAKHEGAGGAAVDGSPRHVLAWRLQDDLPFLHGLGPLRGPFFVSRLSKAFLKGKSSLERRAIPVSNFDQTATI